MKRLTLLLLMCVILLCGCGADAGDQTEPTVTIIPEVTEPPTFAQYEENHAIESVTGGSVKRYRVASSDYYGLCSMGEGILLFSGEKETTLTYVTRDNLPISTTISGSYFTPNDPSVQVTENGVSYYDSGSHSLVFLDLQLRIHSKINLTEEVPQDPLLSQDWKLLYYYTNDALRCLDLRSGISRLLKESNSSAQKVNNIHFGGELLECAVMEGEIMKTLLVSTKTGETVFSSQEQPQLFTDQQKFFALWQENGQQFRLFGTRGEDALRLLPLWDGTFLPQPEQDFVTAWRSVEGGTELAWYDLTQDGVCSSICLNGVTAPVGVVADEKNEVLWILGQGASEYSLYCWDFKMSLVCEEVQTLATHYTAESPDTEGLEACLEQAKSIGEQYGIKLRLWEDAADVVPNGYTFIPEHSVELYEQYLPALEKAISAFPEEIYRKLGKKSSNGKLTICLVREIQGSGELGSLTTEQGGYFIRNGRTYMVLTINERIESSYYHGLFHALDSYVIMECKSYDDWNALNPKGFSYDNSYLTNENRDPENYLEGDNRAFIDVYSMSYPKEDRARIMEYGMQEGNGDYFTSPIMAQKLKTLCKGIRKAFDLEDDERSFPWEQYLSS